MPLHPSNEAILKARFPHVLEELKSFTRPPKTLQSERRSLAQKCPDPVSGTCYAVCGFGEGEHLAALLAKADSFTYFFVAEPNVAYLYSVLSESDLSFVLKDPRVILSCGPLGEDFFKGMFSWNLSLIKTADPLILDDLFKVDPEYYKAFISSFAKYLQHAITLQKTATSDSKLWLEKTLINFPKLIGAPDVSSQVGVFKDLPIVLVSAGPSLDHSFDFLRSIRKYAVIVAVNTAYGPLVKNGIKPHITVAADPRESTYMGYEGADTSNVYLIAPYLVNEKVVKDFEGRTFTWSNDNFLVDYARGVLGWGPATPVVEQGTVSASIFSLATIWGASKLCLVGQDLAIPPGGQTHSSDSFYIHKQLALNELNKYRKIAGNTLSEVYCDEKLSIYLQVFSALANKHQNLEVINTSMLGAKIPNIPFKSFSEAEKFLGKHSSADVLERLEAVYSCRECINMKGLFEELVTFSQDILDKSLSGALVTMQSLKKAKNLGSSGIKNAFHYAEKVNQLMSKNSEEKAILLSVAKQDIDTFLSHCRDRSYEDKTLDALYKNKQYFWALAEGAHTLLTLLRRVG